MRCPARQIPFVAWRRVNERSRTVFLCLALLVLLLSANAESAPAQVDVPRLLERLEGLFRQAQANQVAPANDFPIPQRPMNQMKARQERLDTWCATYLHWLSESLDLNDDQKKQTQELLSHESSKNQRQWQRRQGNVPLPDTTVILFAGYGGPVVQITSDHWEKQLLHLLADGQKKMWMDVSLTRKSRIRDQYARRATALVDTELYLSPEVRDVVYQAARKLYRRDRTNGLFAFNRQSTYMRNESLVSLVTSVDDQHWTEAQQRRINDLRRPSTNQRAFVGTHVVIRGNQQEETWKQQVHVMYESAEKEFLNASAVRTSWMKTALELTPEQARHLELAGKGSTIRCLRRWKKSTQQRLDSVVDRSGDQNRATALNPPDITAIEEDQLWKHAFDEILRTARSEIAVERNRFVESSAVDFLMATLDRELVLHEHQISALRKLFEDTQPHLTPTRQPYLLELAMIVRAMSRINPVALREVLTEPQMSNWNLMASSFRVQNKSSAIVTVQHGQLQLSLGP